MVATPLYYLKLFLSSRRDFGCDNRENKDFDTLTKFLLTNFDKVFTKPLSSLFKP